MFRFSAPAKSLTRSLIATAVVSVSALALGATPALATTASQASAPSYRCHFLAFEPRLSADGHEITGKGASLCRGTGWQDQQIVVTLEEQLFPTLYVVRAQASTGYSPSPHLSQAVSWNCTGTGTHLYTIETSWYGQNGAVYSYKFPPESVSITC